MLQKLPEIAGIVKVTQVQFIDEIVKVQNMMGAYLQPVTAFGMREREGSDVLPSSSSERVKDRGK